MKGKKEALPLMNEQINAEQVQLITHTGENIGVVPIGKALLMAEEAGLDLVMIAEHSKFGVPVTKIMDFGKVEYEKKKKQTEAKKHQKVIQLKEIKLSPKIGEHDYQTKIKKAIEFLKEGKRIKITLSFRGRENITKVERGTELFDKIHASFEASGLLKNLVQEKDVRVDHPFKSEQVWSRIYYLKSAK